MPYLARHHRVVTYDGPGNGALRPAAGPGRLRPRRSGRATRSTVLDATGTDRAVLVGLSQGGHTGRCDLAANHADRVLGTVLIGPSVPLADRQHAPGRASDWPTRPTLPRVPGAARRAATRRSTGRSTTATTGAATTRTSCGSSSGSASPSRTPPSRSRTASAGAARPRPRCSIAEQRVLRPDAGDRRGRGAPASARRCPADPRRRRPDQPARAAARSSPS